MKAPFLLEPTLSVLVWLGFCRLCVFHRLYLFFSHVHDSCLLISHVQGRELVCSNDTAIFEHCIPLLVLRKIEVTIFLCDILQN